MKSTLFRGAAFGALALFVVATFVGCSGKPSGFPKVKPCVITVTNGTEPIEGVEVALSPDETMSGVIVGGKTDAEGKCVVNTVFANYSAPGAPEGSYTVTFKKLPDLDDMPELTAEQMGTMSRGDIDKYYKERDAKIKAAPQIVSPEFTSFQTSPVKVNIPADSAVGVDVGAH